MNLDQALQDLQAAAAGRAGAPPTERIVAARRRRRLVRRTTAAAVSAAATVAVVGGVWASARPPLPAPPVETVAPSPSVAPTPTPTPTSSAPVVALPPGDPSLPFGVCGSLASSPPADPVSDVVSAYVALDAAQVAVGEPVELSAGFADAGTGGPEMGTGVLPGQGPALLWLRDGVVVGVEDAVAGTWSGWQPWFSADWIGASTVRAAVVPTVCTPGLDLAEQPRSTALPPGDYEVVALGRIAPLGPEGVGPDVWDLDDAQLGAAAEAAGVHTALSAPVAVTLRGEADAGPVPVAPRVGGALGDVGDQLVGDPACGAPAPVPAGTDGGGLGVEIAPPPTSPLPVGEGLPASATVRYEGPGAVELSLFLGPQLWIVRDGVVVGTSHTYTDVGYGTATIGSGASLPLGLSPVATACEDPSGEGRPVGAGTYEAYVGVVVVSGRVLVDGAWRSVEHSGVAFSGPFTVTYEE